MSDESTGEICVLMNLKLMGGQYLVDEDRIGVAEDGLLHLSAGRCRFDGLHGRYPSAVSQAARKGCSTVWGSMYSSTVVREQGACRTRGDSATAASRVHSIRHDGGSASYGRFIPLTPTYARIHKKTCRLVTEAPSHIHTCKPEDAVQLPYMTLRVTLTV